MLATAKMTYELYKEVDIKQIQASNIFPALIGNKVGKEDGAMSPKHYIADMSKQMMPVSFSPRSQVAPPSMSNVKLEEIKH